MPLVDTLKLLGLIVLVLVEIAASVAYVNHVVRFRSGLNNNETLRRMWSKPEQIVFQPVTVPLVLSLVVCGGVNTLARGVMIGFLQIIDALRGPSDLSLAADFAVTITGTAAGSLAAAIIYIVDGGANIWYSIAGTLALSLFFPLSRIAGRSHASVLVLWIVVITGVVVFVSLWASRIVGPRSMPKPQVRQLIPTLGDAAAGASRTKVFGVFFACLLLMAVLRICDFLIVIYTNQQHYRTAYLALVLRNFAGVMALIGCSFTAIIVTNFSIMNRVYSWQWPSVLAPLVCLAVVELVLLILGSHPSLGLDVIVHYIRKVLTYAAAGYLGAGVYLGVLAKAANEALNPGVEGQSELIVDDDDDSEYEIGP